MVDYASHPVRKFLDEGLLVTINTDDPGISGIDLRYEYEVAAPQAGLSPGMTRVLQENAVEAAFLPPSENLRCWNAARQKYSYTNEHIDQFSIRIMTLLTETCDFHFRVCYKMEKGLCAA